MFDAAPMRCAEIIVSLDARAKRKQKQWRTASVLEAA
jgi:hypothetical protein